MNKRVRAVIKENQSILLIHRKKPDREYWVFPGGGLEETDPTPETGLVRECKEELGVVVDVGPLIVSLEDGVEIQNFYQCTIREGVLGSGTGPEFSQPRENAGSYAIEWVPVGELSQMQVFPTEVRDLLAAQ